MNYVIKYAFTKENPIPFKTQAEIVNSSLIPLTEDKSFLEKKISFYIRKENLTGVTLSVYVEEEDKKDMQNIVKKYTESLKPNPHDDWTGEPTKTDFFSKTPFSCDENFYKYLEDIAWIGIGLHKKDLTLAVPFAVEKAYETMRIPITDQRFYEENKRLFSQHFYEASEQYKKKTEDEVNKFWGKCGFSNYKGTRWGPHFYYDVVLGLDPFNFTNPTRFNLPSNLSPCETFLKFIVSILQRHNIDLSIPPNVKTCPEAIAHLINKALMLPN